jgi:acyl dehydratase
MHIDIDVARSAGMDDVFAHGMLSMAYAGRAIRSWLPDGALRSFRTRFVSITPVHAAPVVTGRVTSVEPDDAGSLRVRLEWRMTLVDGRETLRGDAELIYKPHDG